MKQNLEVYGRLYDVKNLKTKIEYLCEKLRLNEFINKITGELSSGQKNRVSLAKSVINDPKFCFLMTQLHLLILRQNFVKVFRGISKRKKHLFC